MAGSFSVTYTAFTAGTPAVDAQVNTNFDDIEAELNDFPTDGSLADGCIDTAQLATDAVDGTKIADDAVDSEHYTNGSIDAAHYADDSIADAKLGTDVMHDSEGGYNYCDVNGTKTAVYTKYLTGDLDDASTTTISHGVTTGTTKILTASIITYDGSSYSAGGMFNSASSAKSIWLAIGADDIVVTNQGTSVRNRAYKIKIDYIL